MSQKFISKAFEYANKIRNKHLAEPVLIGTEYASAKRINATVIAADNLSTTDTTNLSIQFFQFVVNRCDLDKHKIVIIKGLKIWRANQAEYEVVLKSKQTHHYSEPVTQNEVTIHTTQIKAPKHGSIN